MYNDTTCVVLDRYEDNEFRLVAFEDDYITEPQSQENMANLPAQGGKGLLLYSMRITYYARGKCLYNGKGLCRNGGNAKDEKGLSDIRRMNSNLFLLKTITLQNLKVRKTWQKYRQREEKVCDSDKRNKLQT